MQGFASTKKMACGGSASGHKKPGYKSGGSVKKATGGLMARPTTTGAPVTPPGAVMRTMGTTRGNAGGALRGADRAAAVKNFGRPSILPVPPQRSIAPGEPTLKKGGGVKKGSK